MNSKPRKRRKILRSIGMGLVLVLFLTLCGDALQNLFGPMIATIMNSHAQPVSVSEEKMLSDWKEMRKRAKRQRLEGQ